MFSKIESFRLVVGLVCLSLLTLNVGSVLLAEMYGGAETFDILEGILQSNLSVDLNILKNPNAYDFTNAVNVEDTFIIILSGGDLPTTASVIANLVKGGKHMILIGGTYDVESQFAALVKTLFNTNLFSWIVRDDWSCNTLGQQRGMPADYTWNASAGYITYSPSDDTITMLCDNRNGDNTLFETALGSGFISATTNVFSDPLISTDDNDVLLTVLTILFNNNTSSCDGATCEWCLTNSGCEWCLETNVCQALGGECQNYYTDPDQCPTYCTTYTTCVTCTTDASCFWCPSSGESQCLNNGDSCSGGHISKPKFCPKVLEP